MELKQLQQRKVNIINKASIELERLRLFIKHLSFVKEHANNNYNITKSILKEIDSFRIDNNLHSNIDESWTHDDTLSDMLMKKPHEENKDVYECRKQNVILTKNMQKEIQYLKKIIDYLSEEIIKQYQIQKLNEYRPFRHYWDQQEFEKIFIASMCMNLPFNITYTIALYAVGKIIKCHNPHKIDKELLILHENQHKQWFMCDYPLKAIVCSKCFTKYVKQCHGCKKIVLSNTINSLTMDNKWYCTQSIECIFGFTDDYVHPS